MMSDVRARLMWACVLVLAGCSFEAPSARFGADMARDQGGSDLAVVEDQGEGDQGEASDLEVRDQGGDQDQGVEDLGGDQGGEDLVEVDQGPMTRECGGEMVDVLTSPLHCGGCDAPCDPKFGVCEGGRCGCVGEGMEVCGGRCEDTGWDPNHCGGCGVSCGPAGACVGGECKCRPGYTLCGGECVDLQSDPGHCGQCGRSCEGKACRSGSCRGGDGCDFGWGRCGMEGGYACLQNMSNDLHCRGAVDFGCGSECAADEVCRRGTFEPNRCRKVRLGRGCVECPCEDCGDEACEYAPRAVSRVWCVD